jgi:hypothetical protein
MRRTAIACVFLVLPSCGLFAEIDATPVAEISDARHQISRWKTDVTMRLVQDPANGMSATVRQSIVTAWTTADTAESDLHREIGRASCRERV